MNPETTTETSKKIITLLTLVIALLGATASLSGIFSGGGPGSWIHESVRGFEVEIYGHRHHPIVGGFLYLPKFPNDKKHKENTARCFVK